MVLLSLVQGWISLNLEPDFGSCSQIFKNLNLTSRELDFRPSENWNRENLSEYEFIGIQQRWPKDLQCKSEKLTRLQRNPDNSELCSSCRSFIIRSTTLENMPDLHRPCPCTKCNGALIAACTLQRHASHVPPTALPLFSAWSQHLAGATTTQSSGSSDSDVDGVGHSHGSSQHNTEHSQPSKRF